MTNALFVNPEGQVSVLNLDLSQENSEVPKVMKGSVTFLGKTSKDNVVLVQSKPSRRTKENPFKFKGLPAFKGPAMMISTDNKGDPIDLCM